MNWTEGALARHSRRKGWDKDAARQKQYFAKARARKNAPASSKGLVVESFVPDYIPQTERHQDRQSISSTPAKKQKTPKRKLIHRQHDTVGTPRQDSIPGVNLELPKPDGQIDHSPARCTNKSDHESDIARKRRKLLEKGDWTGVSTQKPLMAGFAGQKDRSPRSRGTRNFRQNHESVLSPHRSGQNYRYNKGTLGNPTRDEMRINIGSQNLRWSRDSNSVRSLATRQDLTAHLSTTSDSTPRPEPMSPYQDMLSVQAAMDITARPRGSNLNPNHCDSRNHPSSPAHNNAYGYTGQQEDWRKGSKEPRFIVNAHTPIIHQPQPTRKTRSPMLDVGSPGTEENMSTTAVLGAPKRPYARITSEDIRWNLWLNPSAETAPKELDQMEEADHASRPVSPGISHFWNSSEQYTQNTSPLRNETLQQESSSIFGEPQLQSSESSPSSILASDSVQDEIPHPGTELPQIQAIDHLPSASTAIETCILSRSPHRGISESFIKPRSDPVLPVPANPRMTHKAQDLLDLLAENEKRHELSIEKQVDPDTITDAEDEDEIWKRFVFDNDPVETKRKAYEEATEQTKRDLGLGKTKTLCVIEDPLLPPSSAAPQSDVAEPPSEPRDLLANNTTLDMTSDQTEERLGADQYPELEEDPPSETAARTDITDTIDSTMAQPSSPQPPQADFKFHQPQLFTGRLAGEVSSTTPPVSLYAPPKSGRRLRKRWGKGRPDFRALPNYEDDPIEED
ncbi:hypothetical protein NW768_005002 [Fusarium equiseti]|uniref:Uncharacterized protein n=1 Tax=Fusarium equiseti TaxID=61235 RepID=A0ABQ8RE31_FUSEQ|nr:hypothetical protein NW768_005002 [Fusarium equiseti]